jgi:uridine phosphorylase
MSRRRYEHSNNAEFRCRESVILLPFGRESFLPEIVGTVGGRRLDLGSHTDRMAFELDGREVPITLVYSGLGGAAVANALEMIAANGGRRVIVFGACGGADPTVGVGDLIVPTAAVRGDGASPYYAPIQFPAVLDPDLVAALWRRARESSTSRSHRGIVITTDASYRQGPEVYEEYRGLALAVECECATAAVVGLRLGLNVGGLLFCTDNVIAEADKDRSYAGLGDSRVLAGFQSGLEAVVAALE